MNIILRSSPNKNQRPEGVKPSLIIIHATAGKSEAGDVEWCCTPKPKNPNPVSYHYIIGRGGQIYQLVPDKERAWHAGESSWKGRKNCNDFSIGIGISSYNPDEGFSTAQYDACKSLVEMLRAKHDIPLVRVVGHYHVSPGRKTDPWYAFEWMRVV